MGGRNAAQDTAKLIGAPRTGYACGVGSTSLARALEAMASMEKGKPYALRPEDAKRRLADELAGLCREAGVAPVVIGGLAVNHHDTDNPHTHVLIRGRRPDGQELFIPSRLISSGIREHAQVIATRVLGPRLAPEIEQSRFNDISLKAPNASAQCNLGNM